MCDGSNSLAVKGTPVQLLLLNLAAIIDNVDACIQKKCAVLKTDVCKMVARFPEPAAAEGNPLLLLTPPADETAEEEVQRVAQEIKDLRCVHRKGPQDSNYCAQYWGECDREICTDVRHEETKATLEKIGFHVRPWIDDGPFREVYVRWKSVGT